MWRRENEINKTTERLEEPMFKVEAGNQFRPAVVNERLAGSLPYHSLAELPTLRARLIIRRAK